MVSTQTEQYQLMVCEDTDHGLGSRRSGFLKIIRVLKVEIEIINYEK